MFKNLNNTLSNIFKNLTSRGVLTESDINNVMREIRIALLEADVALTVVKEFIEQVKLKALGAEVINSIQPGHMVIKIVQDALEEILGSESQAINLSTRPPAVIMMVGLQGSGKTTNSAKLGLYLTKKHHKKVLLTSLDIYRPAAQKQLEVLAQNEQLSSLSIIDQEQPIDITNMALKRAREESFDIVILDTAGRLQIDEALMQELVEIKNVANPIEIMLVADSLLGQEAVNIASTFNEKLALTGIILTRIDGDGRGGAALSMKYKTGCAIKFISTGEKIADFEEFHPKRMASRILGKGDIVTLVEKAAENIDAEEAKKMSEKMLSGRFNFNDLLKQLRTMKKMGGASFLMNMIPGMSKLTEKMSDLNIGDKTFIKQEAIILSMTKKERANPALINPSRKKRIAAGSGTTVQDVNIIIKQQFQMEKMLKKFGKMDKKTMARSLMGKMG
jgi:signal recognition particle subunit SRP54